jgi:hypothetical protein
MTKTASALLLVLALASAPVLAACGQAAAPAADPGPATLEEIDGSEVKKVIFSEDADAAIGVKTGTVAAGSTEGKVTMPYAAVIYYTDGSTWTYTMPEPRTFVRAPVTVASIAGDVATLSAGPAPGTVVVVVGAPEILGAELEIDGEQ